MTAPPDDRAMILAAQLARAEAALVEAERVAAELLRLLLATE